MRLEAENWAFDLTKTENPSHEDCVRHALSLAKMVRDTKEAGVSSALFIASFIGHAWGRWPKKVSGWTEEYLQQAGDDKQLRGVLYMGLALCPNSVGKEVLSQISPLNRSDASEISATGQMLEMNLLELIPKKVYHLDLLWGGFFGNGDAMLLRQICIPIVELLDDDISHTQHLIGQQAYEALYGHLGRNHMGVHRAMSLVHQELPRLDDAFKAIEEMMQRASMANKRKR